MKLKMSDYEAMSTEELREMNSTIVYILRNRIRIGSKVKINHHKTRGIVYTVTEIRRIRASVRDQYGSLLNVPISLIELY